MKECRPGPRLIGAQTSRALAGLLTILMCAGCVPFPVGVFTKDPFRPEILAPLREPGADKELVRSTLGNPETTKVSGQYWFYLGSRMTWAMLGAPALASISDDDWLFVRFDKTGKVESFERAHLGKCASTGLCYRAGVATIDGTAGRSEAVGADECVLYLFVKPWRLEAFTRAVRFSIDGQIHGTSDYMSYLLVRHRQGEAEISSYAAKLKTNCAAGQRLFVQATKDANSGFDEAARLLLVSAREGEEALRSRRLALPD